MKHHHQHFKDREVELDGNEFVDCTFERCQLMYYGGATPRFDGCSFDHAVFMFERAAGNTLHVLRDLYHAGLKETVEATFDDIRKNPPV